MKRSCEQQFPPVKRTGAIAPEALPQMQPTTLARQPATDAQMAIWKPKLRPTPSDWEENVLCILAEEYSCWDARINHEGVAPISGGRAARILSMRGKCPLCNYGHRNNHWVLINTTGYETTLFLCHHNNQRRLIDHKLPFPVSSVAKYLGPPGGF